MCRYFLENVFRILVYIRADIYNLRNIGLIRSLTTVIDEELTNSELIKLIEPVVPELRQQLIVQDGELCIIREEDKAFLMKVLNKMCEALEVKNYDVAHDLVDMLHVFPEVIVANDKKRTKEYWKIYVKPLIRRGVYNETR